MINKIFKTAHKMYIRSSVKLDDYGKEGYIAWIVYLNIERYNRKDKQLRIIRQGDFVIAERTVDLDVGSETEQLVREADAFAVKMDNLFRTIPKNLIGR